jgi:hypothetical protein
MHTTHTCAQTHNCICLEALIIFLWKKFLQLGIAEVRLRFIFLKMAVAPLAGGPEAPGLTEPLTKVHTPVLPAWTQDSILGMPD